METGGIVDWIGDVVDSFTADCFFGEASCESLSPAF
jgi:hypothetical protein